MHLIVFSIKELIIISIYGSFLYINTVQNNSCWCGGFVNQRPRHIAKWSLDSLRVHFATLIPSSTSRMGWSLATCRAIVVMAFRSDSSLDILGAYWYSVHACFINWGRWYGRCQMRVPCHWDIFLHDHTTLVRNLKGEMMSQTYDVIHQNDLQKVRYCIFHAKLACWQCGKSYRLLKIIGENF